MILTGKNRRTGRETGPSATSLATNPTWTELGANRASAVKRRRLTLPASRGLLKIWGTVCPHP
jgi:hypothetical protein